MSYSHQEPTRVCNTDNEVRDAYGSTRAPDEFHRDRFNDTSKVLGNPILESFERDSIVTVKLPGFGPRKTEERAVQVNRKLAHLFVAAFEKIKAENLSYVLHEVGTYLFRYQQNESVKAAIANRPEYAELRNQRGFWERWNIDCAKQDRERGAFDERVPYPKDRTGTRAKRDMLSNHAWGSALDLNWATNPYKKGARFDMPRRIVEILEGFGFHWGGYYHDYMHFEYLRSTIVGVPDEEPPQVFFPFAAEQQRESPLKYYFLNERGGGGYFPLGLQQNLHGGVHLEPDSQTALVPVRATMPGYIVAARLMAPGTGGDNPIVRDVTDGRHLGFVLIRHELLEKTDSSSSQGQAQTPPAEGKVHPLYSLYMHLAPPAWEGPGSQGFEKAEWLDSFLKMQFGGVVNLDPDSPEAGKTFWAQEPLNPEAASFKVHGLPSPLTAQSGGRTLALSKPCPEDVNEAVQALKAGAIVTFDRALFPVNAGDTIGFVAEGLPTQPPAPGRLPRYLHWELLAPAVGENGIQLLEKKAEQGLFKKVKEVRENNFLEMPSRQEPGAKNEVQKMLEATGDPVVENLLGAGYERVLRRHFNDGKTFFSDETNETAPFTYPVEISIDNKHQYKGEQGGTCVLEVTYKKGGEPLPSGTERITLNPNQGKVTLNVPAAADELSLWSPHFFLDKSIPAPGVNPRPARYESRITLFKQAVSRRWRNLVLDHMNEWTPKGLEVQLDARREAAYLEGLVDDGDEAFKEFKRQLRPLSWWSRRKDADDPFGEVPVLGTQAEEKSIFGSGDHLLPEDANVFNMHPVTALWLIDILLEKEAIAFKKSWPPATLKRGENTQQPPFLGLLWKEKEPRVGMEVLPVLVQHGYGTTDGTTTTNVAFWVSPKGGAGMAQEPLLLCRAPYADGVAMGRLRFPFWGNWEVYATDGGGQRFEPVKTGATQLEVPKPEHSGQPFELRTSTTTAAPATKARPLATGTFICQNRPVTLAGYIVFEHWKVPKQGEPTAPTFSQLALPVLATRPDENEKVVGGLKYKSGYIVGREKEKSNPKVTANFSFEQFVKHQKFGAVFEGNVKTEFKLAIPLANRLQELQVACLAKRRNEKGIVLAVKRLAFSGLSLLVVPASSTATTLGPLLDTIEAKLGALPASDDFSVYRDEEESAIEITYHPKPSVGPLSFDFDPGPALGRLAAEVLSAEGETLHVRPRFIAPNGGHMLLAGKESPIGDTTKLISASAEDIKAACGNDFLELVADKTLPPVARFEFGETTIKMGRGKVHTEVRLHGDPRLWGAASPIIKLEGAAKPKGRIVGQSLTADWEIFKDEKGAAITGRWGTTLKFSAELTQPDKVATPPPPATWDPFDLKPSLVELTREIGAKELKFVGKAKALPTDIPLHIICERLDETGQWEEDLKITELIRYKIPLKNNPHFGNCKETGEFEASLLKTALKKTPGTFRFTWLPKGQRTGPTVEVQGIAVEGVSAPEVKPEDLGP